ncbi:anthrone oxygenase family protein [Erythrobacter sp. Alg231-14]|uniref:anthrone oxygenase family protein n=1 Tax=Erythrobacter sp. Alg231-14 TaxID=1922225 RepID=UPI000D55D7F0
MLDLFHAPTTILLGIFAGAQLTEAWILVPLWRRLAAEDFFRLHHIAGPKLFRFFAPLTALSVIAAIASAAIDADNLWRVAAAVLCVGALVMFFVFFKAANQSFADRLITDQQLPGALKQWARWHGARTTMVLTSFGCSVIALAT